MTAIQLKRLFTGALFCGALLGVPPAAHAEDVGLGGLLGNLYEPYNDPPRITDDYRALHITQLQATLIASLRNTLRLDPILLGRTYEEGLGVPRNIAIAQDMYLQGAVTGNYEAMMRLGVSRILHSDMSFIKINEALMWFRQATTAKVRSGNAPPGELEDLHRSDFSNPERIRAAQESLLSYFPAPPPPSLPQTWEDVIAWVRQRAAAEDPQAQYVLALCLTRRDCLAPEIDHTPDDPNGYQSAEYAEVIRLLDKASYPGGHVQARIALGDLVLGPYPPPSGNIATVPDILGWLRTAAMDQSLPLPDRRSAMMRLAMIYGRDSSPNPRAWTNTLLPPTDRARAAHWNRQIQQLDRSPETLAANYLFGNGVDKNPAENYFWCAVQFFPLLCTGDNDASDATIPQAQRRRAAVRAANWRRDEAIRLLEQAIRDLRATQ